jgi:hypothetical protein
MSIRQSCSVNVMTSWSRIEWVSGLDTGARPSVIAISHYRLGFLGRKSSLIDRCGPWHVMECPCSVPNCRSTSELRISCLK